MLTKLQKIAKIICTPGNKYNYVIQDFDLPYFLDIEGSRDRMTHQIRSKVLNEVIESGLKKMIKFGVTEEIMIIIKECREELRKVKDRVKEVGSGDDDIE